MDTFLPSIALVLLLLAFPLYIGFTDWRAHQTRVANAEARGWRYRRRLPSLTRKNGSVRSGFVIVSSTDSGIIWELIQDSYQRYYVWSAYEVKAPYGTMVIMPRYGTETQQVFDEAGLRTVAVDNPAWHTRYVALATHDHLVRRSLSKEVEIALMNWPAQNEPGALQYVVWRKDGVEIRGRYHNDWNTVDRVVALGTAMVEQIRLTDPASLRPNND